MFRRLVRVVSPVNRMAVAAFVWTHRRTIMRWGRTLLVELRATKRADPARWWMIVKVLWSISTDEQLASASQLRRIELDGDVIVADVPQRWAGRHRLADRLADIDGIERVEDQRGQVLTPSIGTTAA